MEPTFASLDELRDHVSGCRRCPLCEGRAHVVFGSGSPQARVLVVGEAPGRNEDAQGEPFVGAAGRRLETYLQIAGLSRDQVFIANVLKCRPPDNRNPRVEEIAQCAPYLREQTRLIDPEVIVTLGNFATHFVLKTDRGISELHGRLIRAGRFSVLPMFHPAAGLYDQRKRPLIEQDFATLGRFLRRGACDAPEDGRLGDALAGIGEEATAPALRAGATGGSRAPAADVSAPPADFDPVAYVNEPRWRAASLGLDRMRALLDRLGNPQRRVRCVHVAGTNGKGSTCAYIESALRCAGYRTGLFTSPYVIRFEERIRVCGDDIGSDDLRDVTWRIHQHAEAMEAEGLGHPTEFELMFAIAMAHFADQGCDIAVIEVGLGGRLDATNALDASEVCVITPVSLDHTDWLGTTLPQIASEKAGIIKPGCPVVCGPQTPEAHEVIEGAAAKAGVAVRTPAMDALSFGSVAPDGLRPFTYGGRPFRTRLLGRYQPGNAAVAIEALEVLRERGWNVSERQVRQGIEQASWPGRFEVLPAAEGRPAVVVDGGHNVQGARALAASLTELFGMRSCVLVMSVLADKDYPAMVDAVLPAARACVCVTADSPRALDAADLAACVRERAAACERPVEVSTASGFEEALRHAGEMAGPQGAVCVFGSLYSLAAAYRALAVLGVTRA
ncbi:uracil-DNA glycosylase family protein [Berryella wangjianweii]|nr:uracil-DNA glycosylase family protein [Berryella wangjianweii]